MVWQKMVCAEHYLIEGDTSRALLHEANERHHCAMQSALQQSALQQSPHASVTRECHKHCQVVHNVTKNLNMTIDMKRRTLHQPML